MLGASICILVLNAIGKDWKPHMAIVQHERGKISDRFDQ